MKLCSGGIKTHDFLFTSLWVLGEHQYPHKTAKQYQQFSI